MTTNSDLLEVIEDNVARALEGADADREKITSTVRAYAQIQATINSVEISEQDIIDITKRLETRFDIRMGAGTLLSAEGYIPWLDDAREKINWYYWDRYKRLLPDKKFNREVINVLDIDTNKIIDHLENPHKKGSWKRKGLCVGHVQSGKTANYLGVICKAADAGYKVIIVLAGLLNALRNQTQERIDEGFVGLDSSQQLEATSLEDKLTGVGKFYHPSTWRTPVPLTTSTQDFDRKIATQLRAQISQFNEPVIFVLKKNVSILKNLIDWLRNNNVELNRFPMLLIDDEADHASVNTSSEEDDPTATNRRIRELLSLFEQSSYLGYTATPFANIFIDPDTDDEMLKDDLFPSDFIISLDTPSNYVGAKRIFEDDGDLDIVREIDDYKDILPLRHKIDEIPATLPTSLYDAVRAFILIRAMRILRGQGNSHNSMLVNVSRFTNIQSNIKWQLHEYLEEMRQAIINHFALSEREAMSNSNMLSLRKTWEKEFSRTEFSWGQVQETLKAAVSPVKVIEVNGSRRAEPLDYNSHDYPNGRSVIAVGGLSLSRGLTLEGLTVSYFLRNSIMYDTLMQMGRWFGYRSGFEDLCRIYMTEEAVSWYAHISRVTEELREEFKRMEQAKMTPRDFGLCVRSHPETLIVTARNKMRTAKPVFMQVNLYGRSVETAVLKRTEHTIQNNLNAVTTLVNSSAREGSYEKFNNSHLFRQVPIKHIKLFLDLFINHPASPKTANAPLIHYLNLLHQEDNIASWDVVLIHKLRAESTIPEQIIAGYQVKAQRRKMINIEDSGVAQENRRIGSDKDEQAGLEPEIFQRLLATFGSKSKITAISCRKERKRPLLMLHLLDCQLDGESINETGIFAFGISFPGESMRRRPERLVEYQVNTTWWKNNYQDILDDESILNE
ncbi:endonuclease [Desulfomarina profundi]|uniref:Endonuclease n=1 Tax=Desulfomarina profundi TaxID=2772557 RepID=A0A8D5FW78_9BACT|nr:Z1 domain-containing protein [Desulfomarina profundi]BCL62784.1 endonuclease [Desulfomarina profundi]